MVAFKMRHDNEKSASCSRAPSLFSCMHDFVFAAPSQDSALPSGTGDAAHHDSHHAARRRPRGSSSSVLGGDVQVSVPMIEGGDDRGDGCDSGRGYRLSKVLVLTLRQVNGDGVMSGVSFVACAHVPLSFRTA